MITLHNKNCLEVMRSMPDKGVDCIITDPPYGVNVEYASFVDTKENLTTLINDFMPEALRIANCVIVFCGNGNQHLYPQPDWTLCWHIPAGNGYNAWGFTTWQPILAYGKPYRENGRAYPDSISMSPTSDDNGHPCPKPDKLMSAIVSKYTAQNWTVFDPFMGSGSTGVACVKLDRNFIGSELSPEYFAIAERRIQSAALQPSFWHATQHSVQRTAIAASQQAQLFTDGNLPSKARGATRRR